MPDITMCGSETCSVRSNCYRNPAAGTKPTEYRQAWFIEQPGAGDTCDFYWPLNGWKDDVTGGGR